MERVDNDKVFEEFVDYQSLTDDEIEHNAWLEAELVDGKDEDGNKIVHYGVDLLWYYIASMRLPETSISRFKVLPRIAVMHWYYLTVMQALKGCLVLFERIKLICDHL